MTWVAVAVGGSAALGAGTAAYQGSKNRAAAKDSIGYDVVNAHTYDFTQGNLEALSQFGNQGLEASSQGQLSPGFEAFFDQQKAGLHQDSSDRFYGTAGRPGTLRDTLGIASLTGLGGKAPIAKGTQAIFDFMTEGRKIDEYILGIKSNQLSKEQSFFPGLLGSIPRGPESSIVNYGGGVSNQGQGGALDLSSLGQLASQFGQPKQQTQNLFDAPGLSGYDISGQYGGGLVNEKLGGGLGTGTYSPGDNLFSSPGISGSQYTPPPFNPGY